MSKPKFHKNFINPTVKQRTSALGPFPFEGKSNISRERMLLKCAELGYQPSLHSKIQAVESSRNQISVATTATAVTTVVEVDNEDKKTKKKKKPNGRKQLPPTSHTDLNNRKLYISTRQSETSKAIPKPSDALDWLAQVPEEGQSFEEYVSYVTTRSTGRIRPIANPDGMEILLLPIVAVENEDNDSKHSDNANNVCNDSSSAALNDDWPQYGPPLKPLVEYTQAFFDRKVRILPSAHVFVNRMKSNQRNGNRKRRKLENKASSEIGAFATSTTKGQLKLFLPEFEKGKYSKPINIAGRCDLTSDRIQIQVTSLLDELSSFRYSRHEKIDSRSEHKDFCIMGITMVDLYDGPKDLFCAGMAFGGDKVAAFSFHRYHPFIKMHPARWHNYGYADECDGYSYYEDGNQNPTVYKHEPPSLRYDTHHRRINSEYLRRSSKLLTHEPGHLFVLDHCIHNRCLMNGTGHLVEDFKAPSHLCGVCLRKLQWRIGFDVKQRYKLLSTAFDEMGMEKEKHWVEKQYDHLK